MIARWIVLVACASCGRIGFESVGTGGDSGGDGGQTRDGTLDDAGNEIVSFGETGTATYSNVTTDTFVDQQHLGFNYGAAIVVESETSPNPMTGLLRFDVSAISSTRTVVAAKLLLHIITENTSTTADIYPVTEAWTEGAVVMATGAASWNDRIAGTAWATAGAGSPGSRGSQSLATFQPSLQNTTIEVPLGPVGIATVQAWVQDASTNHGFAFVSPATLWDFASKEYSTAMNRPVLVVTVAP